MNESTRVQIRQNIRQKRLDLSANQQNKAALTLLKHFASDRKIQQCQHIALYLTNDGELNTAPLIDWCWQHNKNVYLPVIHPFSKGHLLFLQYTRDTVLKVNKYGIAEPKLDITTMALAKQIDIICTPLVAFDNSGNRLGMGGGFYDRTLQSWYQEFQRQKDAKPYPIGIAHNCQQVDELPCQSWDIPLPEVLTPLKHYKFV